jgi:hypothetical protein
MAKKSTAGSPMSYAAAILAESGSNPPSTLAETGARLWQSIQSQYAIADSGGLALLRQLCEAADQIEKIRRVIAADGLLVEGAGGAPAREHPLLKIQLGLRSFMTRTIARLGLDVEPVRQPGRPPGRIGVT